MERWFIKKRVENSLDIKKLNITKFTAGVLSKRGITTDDDAIKFLDPKYCDLETPLKLRDMIIAGNLILSSKNENKKIAICGDYDVDGVMSTVILVKGLRELGLNVIYRIPDREKDGYGINERIVKEFYDEDVSLIITCDNGISAFGAVSYAKSLGMDIIVTDHHEVSKTDGKDDIPKADAVIDPKRSDCSYPFKDLCGAGVAFKLMTYLYKIFGIDETKEKELLPYAAVATVCDVMKLVGENRIIVKYGLSILNESDIKGFSEIIKKSSIKNEVDVYGIGFIIGPTINSAGRLKTADVGVELFLSESSARREEIVNSLKELNALRQNYTESGFKEAIEFIEKNKMDEKFPVLVILNEDLHPAVAGIVAGRLKEKYQRPAIVLTGKSSLKGSGRSIECYDMFSKIQEIKNYLTSFGGHKLACGLSIERENLRDFVREVNNGSNLTKDDLVKTIYLEDVLSIKDVSYNLYEELKKLEPYGNGNEIPIFGFKRLNVVDINILGKKKNVMKFNFTDGINFVEGIFFSTLENFLDLVSPKYDRAYIEDVFGRKKGLILDVCASLDLNEFMGNSTLQLKIKSIKP